MRKSQTPILIVIAGAMGAGKSWIKDKLVYELDDIEKIDTDVITREMVRKEEEAKENGNPERFLTAADYWRSWQLVEDKKEKALEDGRNVVVLESPLAHPQKMEYIAQARDKGYYTRVYYVATENVSINLRRSKKREKDENRGPTPDMIRDSYNDSLKGYLLASQLAQDTIVLNNSVDYSDPLTVFRTLNGKIRSVYSKPAGWMRKFIKKSIKAKGYKNPTDQEKNEDLFRVYEGMVKAIVTPSPLPLKNLFGKLSATADLIFFLRKTVREMKKRGRELVDFRR